MVELDRLRSYCDSFLDINRFDDYCPNGLQVEGVEKIERLATGVTASQALIDAGVEAGADALIVHHGFFWKGESPCLVGMTGSRIRTLIRNGVSLLAYHLPLDAHAEVGNNRQLALRLGLSSPEPGTEDDGLLWRGCLSEPLSGKDLALLLEQRLGRRPLYIAGHDRPVARLGWCTGAAQQYIVKAAASGLDAFISGEVSEQTFHQARELGIHYYAAGHHATERDGVRALGEHLAEKFGLEHRFLDIENPV